MSRLVIAVTVFASLAACDKPTAKFHVGDRVVVKAHPKTKGVVTIRNSPFVDDLYYIRVAGAPDDRASTWIPTKEPWSRSKQWHLEGPYYESQLELDRADLTNR
jgi:hypothetical protein